MLVLNNDLCRSLRRLVALLALPLLTVANAQAGDVISFAPRAKVTAISCSRIFSEDGAPIAQLSSSGFSAKFQTLAEANIFLRKQAGNPYVPEERKEAALQISKSLNTEIADSLRGQPDHGLHTLLSIVGNPSHSLAARTDASDRLSSLAFSKESLAQFEKMILEIDGKMEISTLHPKIRAQHEAELAEQYRKNPFFQGDVGTNSKLMLVTVQDYVKIITDANPALFPSGLIFVKNLLQRWVAEGPRSRDPRYFQDLIDKTTLTLAMTSDEKQLASISAVLTEFGRQYPRRALSVIKQFDSAQKAKGIPATALPELTMETYRSLARQMESSSGRELFIARDEFADVLTSALMKGLIKSTDPGAPISQIRFLLSRYENFGSKVFLEREKSYLYAFTIALRGALQEQYLAPEAGETILRLLEKLNADALKTTKEEDPAALKEAMVLSAFYSPTRSEKEKQLLTAIANSPLYPEDIQKTAQYALDRKYQQN